MMQASQRLAAGLRTVLCLVAVVAGVFVVLGCLLALRLEATGFSRPSDVAIRPSYVALLVVGAFAGVIVPAAVCAVLLRQRRQVITIGATIAVTVTVVAVLLGVT
jgi:hypothetical protein